VVGQLARDLVLSVDDLPEPGSSADATGRLEQLGGKGANQAVGLAQLGAPSDDALLAHAVGDGNLFVWPDGDVLVPLTGDEVVDTTGGGDAFVAALTASLLRGDPYPEAARRATAASGATARHAGGRPHLRAAARG
jgi:ribokinase